MEEVEAMWTDFVEVMDKHPHIVADIVGCKWRPEGSNRCSDNQSDYFRPAISYPDFLGSEMWAYVEEEGLRYLEVIRIFPFVDIDVYGVWAVDLVVTRYRYRGWKLNRASSPTH